MRLKLGVAAGAALFAVGVTLWVMAATSPWARDVRLCTVALGGGLVAGALLWWALLWYAGGVADRLRSQESGDRDQESEDEVEAADAVEVEIEQPVRRRYDLTWER